VKKERIGIAHLKRWEVHNSFNDPIKTSLSQDNAVTKTPMCVVCWLSVTS